jgi:hypothetical protein
VAYYSSQPALPGRLGSSELHETRSRQRQSTVRLVKDGRTVLLRRDVFLRQLPCLLSLVSTAQDQQPQLQDAEVTRRGMFKPFGNGLPRILPISIAHSLRLDLRAASPTSTWSKTPQRQSSMPSKRSAVRSAPNPSPKPSKRSKRIAFFPPSPTSSTALTMPSRMTAAARCLA